MKICLFIVLILTSTRLIAATPNWSLILEEDKIQVYSATSSKSGVIPFKAIGTINAPIKKVTDILLDYKNKPTWSPKLKKVKVHEELSKNEFLFSEYYSTPWPATDREFLLQGKVEKVSENVTVFSANSVDNKFVDKSHIQAKVNYINVKLKKVSETKTNIEFSFHGDMKGWMPVWLMNLIQKKWPMRFIQGIRKQV